MTLLKKLLTITCFLIVSLSNTGHTQCNVNASTCSLGTSASFPFVSPGPYVSTCLDFFGPDYGYIMLYITQSGPLNLLIDGSAGNGFLDVSVFNIPNGVAPCTAIQNTSNEIACNYASSSSGCNQFGTAFSCASSVPAPNVTAGQTIMIVVENWSGSSSSFTLQMAGNAGAAQAGTPNGTINPIGPLCVSAAPVQVTAVNMGGTWSGPGISASGLFNPATAGIGTHTINYTVGVAPCISNTTTTITVGAAPVVTTTPPVQSICSGSATGIALSSSITGTTYNWTVTQNGVTGASAGSGNSIAQTLTNNGTTPGTVIYTITPSIAGCSGAVLRDTVTVKPRPVAAATPAAQTICSGSPTGIALSATVTGTTYSWTVTQNGVAGATAGSGNSIAQTLTNSGTVPGMVIYTITPAASGCAGAVIRDTVTVSPAITPAFAAIPDICAGAAAPVLLTTSTNGVTGTWSPAVVSNTATGTYMFTPDAGQCTTGTASVTITVNPVIAPVFAAIPAICNGTAAPVLPTTSTNGIAGTWNPAVVSNAATGTYMFTPDPGQCAMGTVSVTITVNSNVTPIFAAIPAICNGAAAPVLPTTSTNGVTGTWNPATVSNTASGTYIYTSDAGQCATGTVPVTITVNPNLTPAFAAIPAICNGAAAPVLPITSTNGITGTWNPAVVSNTASATYTFTSDAGQCATGTVPVTITVNPNLTPAFAAIPAICNGAAAPVLPTTSTNGITGTWNPAVVSNTASGTYTFTPNPGQCATGTAALTVTVNPLPVLTVTPSGQAFCSGTATNIALSSNITGTTYAWTIAQNGVTGATAASGGIITQALTNAGTVTGTVIYTITPTSNGCAGTPVAALVTVHPKPVVIATPAGQTLCSGGSTSINLSSVVAGATFAWTAAQSGVTGAAPGNGATITQALTASAPVTGTATYTVTPTANSCPGNPTPVTITVNAIPAVPAIITGADAPCAGSTQVYSISTVPGATGYTWTLPPGWAGTSSANSITVTTGSGNGSIIVSAGNTCGNSAATTKMVTATPVLTPGITISSNAPSLLCSGTLVTFTATVTAAGTLPAYQWKKNGGNVGSSNTYSYMPSEGDTITCMLTSNYSCLNSNNILSNKLVMHVTPTVYPSLNIYVVENHLCSDTAVTLLATPVEGGTAPVYQWKLNNSNVGTSSTSYTYMPADGDLLQCMMTSNAICANPVTVESNEIPMSITPVTHPSVNITVQPGINVSNGQQLVFTAHVSEEGNRGYQVRWYRNNAFTGVVGDTWNATAGVDIPNNSSINAELQSFSPCAVPDSARSNTLKMSVGTTGIFSPGTPGSFRVYPNPAQSSLSFDGLQQGDQLSVCDVSGRVLLTRTVARNNDFKVDITAFVQGIYLFYFTRSDNSRWQVKVFKD